MIVADTNLIVYLLIPNEQSQIARRVFSQDDDWIAPSLWRSEFRNVLAGYMRRQLIALPKAQEIMGIAIRLLTDSEYGSNSNEVLKLVSQSNCSAYDCEFVALAQEFGVPLVTFDQRILREFPDTAVSPTDFLM